MTDIPPRFGPSNTVRLSEEDEVAALVQASIKGLWTVVEQLTRLRRSRRANYRVSIFGSAQLQPGTQAYEEVKRLAAELTRMGCDIVTGGGPGLMQAANEGASSVEAGGRDRSVGIRIALPFEQHVNPFVGDAHEHGTFFSRLHHFALVSDAFVVVPGGVGTLLELAMAWQLLQVRHLRNVPLILIGAMWPGLLAWSRDAMLQPGQELASAEDLALPVCAADVEETVALLCARREEWLRAQASE